MATHAYALMDAEIKALEAALDAIVDERGWWRDVPFALDDYDMEALETQLDPIELPCGFCGARFYPVPWRMPNGWWGDWYYYQPGYWFGDAGNGRHFPVCSDGCHDALGRLLEKRRWHTSQEMQALGRAKRLLKECKSVARRISRGQRVEGCTSVVSGSSEGN